VEKKEKKEEQRNRRNRNNSDGESGDIGSPAIEEQGEISMSFLPSFLEFVSFLFPSFLLSFSWFITKVLFAVLDCFAIVFDVPFSGETQFSIYRDLFSPGLVLLWIWNPVHDNPRSIAKLADCFGTHGLQCCIQSLLKESPFSLLH
jgi:hypothetical protein